jgi:mannose-6-phosphate isomerase-like protein (cupin superfamily)
VEIPPLAGRTLGSPDGQFVVVEWRDAGTYDGPIAPPHVHHRDDEAWYVLEGRLGFRIGDDVVEAGPGAAVLAPAGVVHSFWNAGRPEPARYLLVMPPRLLQMIEELHSPAGYDPSVWARYDSELV